jgi:UDP-glucose 4-epimerase
MQILVVGGAGYIGSHMAKWLVNNGHEVVVLDNLSTGHATAARYGRFVTGDLADRAGLESLFARHTFAAVMHFGAFSQVAESMADPARYYANNVANTLNLLEVMHAHDAPVLVFSSTAAVYGDPETVSLREDHPLRPINPYGRSKRMVEEILEDYGKAYGLRWAALRYFNAAGADPDGELGEQHDPETHLIPIILQVAAGKRSELALYGDDYDTPDGTCIRDYVHVLDLCAAHVRAMEHLLAGGVSRAWNLGNGSGFSVAEVLSVARSVTGKEIPARVMPRRPGDPARLAADSAAARQLLGWETQFAELETIIHHAWHWECSRR